jgi:hypothetical protein
LAQNAAMFCLRGQIPFEHKMGVTNSKLLKWKQFSAA